mgnify:CR=1 FL=1
MRVAFRDALFAFQKAPLLSVLSITTIAFSLFAFALFGLVAINIKRTLERVPIGHDDIAFLQYTGGTTGRAKGAMLTQRNMVANTLQAAAWAAQYPRARRLSPEASG